MAIKLLFLLLICCVFLFAKSGALDFLEIKLIAFVSFHSESSPIKNPSKLLGRFQRNKRVAVGFIK